MLGAMIPAYKDMANTLPLRYNVCLEMQKNAANFIPVPAPTPRIWLASSSTSSCTSPSSFGSSHTSLSPTCGLHSWAQWPQSSESWDGPLQTTAAQLATSCPRQLPSQQPIEHSDSFSASAALVVRMVVRQTASPTGLDFPRGRAPPFGDPPWPCPYPSPCARYWVF